MSTRRTSATLVSIFLLLLLANLGITQGYESNNLLVGIWHSQDLYHIKGFAFYPNGRVALSIVEGDSRGTYTISNNQITLDLTNCYIGCYNTTVTGSFIVTETALTVDINQWDGISRIIFHRIDNITYEKQNLCPGTPENILFPGYMGQVTYTDGTPTRIRSNHSFDSDILLNMPEGTIFFVLDGPFCGEKTSWWHIRLKDIDLEGWAAEGDFEIYYIELIPYPYNTISYTNFTPYESSYPEPEDIPVSTNPLYDGIHKEYSSVEPPSGYLKYFFDLFVEPVYASEGPRVRIDDQNANFTQCTEYVQDKRPDALCWLAPSGAYGSAWASMITQDEKDLYGIKVEPTPSVGAIAVWNQGCEGRDPEYGHVAYVEEINGPYFRVSEANASVQGVITEYSQESPWYYASACVQFITQPTADINLATCYVANTPQKICHATKPWWIPQLVFNFFFPECR